MNDSEGTSSSWTPAASSWSTPPVLDQDTDDPVPLSSNQPTRMCPAGEFDEREIFISKLPCATRTFCVGNPSISGRLFGSLTVDSSSLVTHLSCNASLALSAREILEAARIDGAGEIRLLTKIGIPLAKPAILTALLITFIGPWNEFLWPFLVTKKQEMQPFAVSLANYMQNLAARADNPDGATLAGGVLLAVPAILLFVAFQRHFTSADLGSAVKG